MIRDLFFRVGYGLLVHKLFKTGTGEQVVTSICLHRINTLTDALFPPLSPTVFAEMIRLLKKEYEIAGFADIAALQSSHKGKKPLLVISFDDGYKDFLAYALPVIRKEKIIVNHNIVVNCAETGELTWTQRLNNILSHLDKTGQLLKINYEGFVFDKEVKGQLFAVKRELFAVLFAKPYLFVERLIRSLEQRYSFEQPADEMMTWEEIKTCRDEGVEIGSHTFYHSSLAECQDEKFMLTEKEIDAALELVLKAMKPDQSNK